ncbi:MAG: hypothetical protein M1839_004365 [Geoglossum umbratile]|nr:MAG: hypothetical protein M1839_004365 [Geoglossum umbratile]
MAGNTGKWKKEYLGFLDELYEKNTFVPFNIKTSHNYTNSEELLAELEAKEFPRSDVGGVEMLGSGSLWHITVRQSGVEVFRKICPWQITSGGAGEAKGLGTSGSG